MENNILISTIALFFFLICLILFWLWRDERKNFNWLVSQPKKSHQESVFNAVINILIDLGNGITGTIDQNGFITMRKYGDIYERELTFNLSEGNLQQAVKVFENYIESEEKKQKMFELFNKAKIYEK